MSIMIDLPPAMAQEVHEYEIVRGEPIEQIVFDYIKQELARKAEVDKAIAELDALVRQSHGRLAEPYKFNRADAYEPEVPYA